MRRLILLILFCLAIVLQLKADEADQTALSKDDLKQIREKTLSLLQNLVPASSSGRAMEVMAINGASVYWGNLFDSNEVVALVDLAPVQTPADDLKFIPWLGRLAPQYLSLCAWNKNHWAYRQYVDNAGSLTFHERKDQPRHFVQALRCTGRTAAEFLSWYYDLKTRTLVPTDFKNWGPISLIGNYLCYPRGNERRTIHDTVWIYHYDHGRKGELLAVNDMNVSNGGNFCIITRDSQTQKLWTYSFVPEEETAPYLNYTVNAVEGDLLEGPEIPDALHYSAELKLSAPDDLLDSYCFERLTKLSYELVAAGDAGDWSDAVPNPPPVKEVKFESSGDPEIVRRLKNP